VYGGLVVLLIGSGDNGGDALYAGARLAGRGAAVAALLLTPERAHRGGLAALEAARGRVLPAVHPDAGALIDRADLVLDGIVGIGGRGGLRGAAVPLVERAQRARARIVAVDLPSGVDADTGAVPGGGEHRSVRADVTVTFGTYKPGLLIDPGASRAGEVRLVDIGLGPSLVRLACEDLRMGQDPEERAYYASRDRGAVLTALEDAGVAARLPVPGAESDKYRRGVLGIAAGSERYPGAAVLAVAGALAGGAGAVRYAGSAAREVVTAHPEALVSATGLPRAGGRVQAWVVGPGLGRDERAAEVLGDVLAAEVPVLVDADGLALLAEGVGGGSAGGGASGGGAGGPAPVRVLTPHAGEAARLLGVSREQVEAERLESVRELARRYRATVLLKGSTTLVCSWHAAQDEAGLVRVNTTGTGWLATAGSGDVLSGVVGALLAGGLGTYEAASVGAYLHGLAGRLAATGGNGAGAPIAAGRVAETVGEAWRRVVARG
jgi:hydroxyethylthiazole kinase-like uncharacterized protein yjeF